MKNGYIHDHVLLRSAEEGFRALNAEVRREYPVQVKGRRGVIDLYARFRSWLLATEAENSARRVNWDIAKARAAGANGLIILVPNCRVATACWDAVHREGNPTVPSNFWISVFTLGSFRQWLGLNFGFFSGSFEVPKTFPLSATHHLTLYKHYPSS